MTAVAVELRTSAFDPGRVRAQVRGDRVLIMDRVSGRWTVVDAEWAEVVPLVGARGAARQHPAVRALHEHLTAEGIGVQASERTFGGLNTVIIKLTAACNHACAYCYDFESAFKARRIDRATAIDAVEQAVALADQRLQVILHGGEPMLVWDLVEDVVLAGEQAAERAGKSIRFVGQSNMSRLNARIGRFSIDHGIDWGVSVDGPPDIHDHFRTYRNGRGTYADFDAALHAFPRFIRTCGVLSTVTTANQSRLLEVARYFRSLGMPSWDWTLFQAIGRGRTEADRFEPDVDVLVESWSQLFAAVLSGEMDGFAVHPVLKYVENFVSGPGRNMCMRPQCGAARDLLSISVDGAVEACDCIDRQGPLAGLGAVADSGLARARTSALADRIRSRDLSEQPCGSCIWWGVCGGGCLAHASSLNEVPQAACAIALTAFDAIAEQMIHEGGPLRRYLRSVGVADEPSRPAHAI